MPNSRPQSIIREDLLTDSHVLWTRYHRILLSVSRSISLASLSPDAAAAFRSSAGEKGAVLGEEGNPVLGDGTIGYDGLLAIGVFSKNEARDHAAKNYN